jgi:hypothetical protein
VIVFVNLGIRIGRLTGIEEVFCTLVTHDRQSELQYDMKEIHKVVIIDESGYCVFDGENCGRHEEKFESCQYIEYYVTQLE